MNSKSFKYTSDRSDNLFATDSCSVWSNNASSSIHYPFYFWETRNLISWIILNLLNARCSQRRIICSFQPQNQTQLSDWTSYFLSLQLAASQEMDAMQKLRQKCVESPADPYEILRDLKTNSVQWELLRSLVLSLNVAQSTKQTR